MKNILFIVLLSIFIIGNANAAQVKYKLPDNVNKVRSCEDNAPADLEKYIRRMAVIDNGRWYEWGLFYDIDAKCVIKVYYNYRGDDVTKNKVKAFVKNKIDLGAVYLVGVESIPAPFNSKKYLFTDFDHLSAAEENYDAWVKAEAIKREEKQKEEARAAAEKRKFEEENRVLRLLLPKYHEADPNLDITFDGYKLNVTNKTANFLSIKSISTYLSSKISTYSPTDLELPPNGYDIKGIYSNILLSHETLAEAEFKKKDLDYVKQGYTRFGFAIKYFIGGKVYNFYKTNNYKNIELLAN